MSASLILDQAMIAADRLGSHPQDHGWRELYRLFAHGLRSLAPELTKLVVTSRLARPADSYTHLMVLLGIAIKEVAPVELGRLFGGNSYRRRLQELELVLAKHGDRIAQIVRSRRNSFTCARRFLVPQVLLGTYFGSTKIKVPAVFADLGTGLGILPRQLNSAALYRRFSADLVWPGGIPEFRKIPLAARFGIDMGPRPDLRWVHSCYGPSSYYEHLYAELIEALDDPDVQSARVEYRELDLLDAPALEALLHSQNINCVNLSYVLYEVEARKRTEVVELLLTCLRDPGVVIITEPNAELTQQGGIVSIFDKATGSGFPLCSISDGHFRGTITPLAGYDAFIERYPIRYGSHRRANEVVSTPKG